MYSKVFPSLSWIVKPAAAWAWFMAGAEKAMAANMMASVVFMACILLGVSWFAVHAQ